MPLFFSFPEADQSEKVTGLFLYKNKKGENVYIKLCDCKDVNIEMSDIHLPFDFRNYEFSCKPSTIELTICSNDDLKEKEITEDELKDMMEGLI